MSEPQAFPTAELAECEAIIERGIGTFVEVGEALLRIRDSRLYRETHGTFEDYCRERWGWTRRQANRTIAAADVASALGPIGPTPPIESVARELVPLTADPEQLRTAWQEATETHGPKPTAKQVREVVRKASGRPGSNTSPPRGMVTEESPTVDGDVAESGGGAPDYDERTLAEAKREGVDPESVELAPLEGLFGLILGVAQRVELDHDAITKLLVRAPVPRRLEWKAQIKRGERALATLGREL